MNRNYNALDMNTFLVILKQVFILIPVFILMCPVKYVDAGETLPTHHQVYPIIDALKARGHLAELSQLNRPYTRSDILSSVGQCL
jgi:hypothetical protein